MKRKKRTDQQPQIWLYFPIIIYKRGKKVIKNKLLKKVKQMKVLFFSLSCSTIVPETRSYFAHPSFHQWWGRKGPWWTGRWCCCETSLTAPSARQSWSCGPLGCQLHLSHKHTHRHAWLTTHSPVICISTMKETMVLEMMRTHKHTGMIGWTHSPIKEKMLQEMASTVFKVTAKISVFFKCFCCVTSEKQSSNLNS